MTTLGTHGVRPGVDFIRSHRRCVFLSRSTMDIGPATSDNETNVSRYCGRGAESGADGGANQRRSSRGDPAVFLVFVAPPRAHHVVLVTPLGLLLQVAQGEPGTVDHRSL